MSNRRHSHKIQHLPEMKRLNTPREVIGGGQPKRGTDNRRIIAVSKGDGRIFFLHATKGIRSYQE